jgi:hypothetical protein
MSAQAERSAALDLCHDLDDLAHQGQDTVVAGEMLLDLRSGRFCVTVSGCSHAGVF